MAFAHGKSAAVSVGGTLLSAYLDNAALNISQDTSDTTTFGSNWKTALAGLAGATISMSGNYDPTASTGVVVKLTGLIGAGPTTVIYYPAGNSSGQISHTFSAILTSYSESSPVADKVTVEAEFLVTGAVVTAII